MERGKVKWFDRKKGFGFIQNEDVSRDIFVHYSDIVGQGFRTLDEGEEVEFQLEDGPKGPAARGVVRLSSPPSESTAEAM